MNDHKKINKEDAREGLNTISNLNKRTANRYRGPFWLNIMFVISLTLYAFAHSMHKVNEFWSDIKTPLFLITLVFGFVLIYLQIKSGVKLRKTAKRRLVDAGFLISLVGLLQVGAKFTNQGYPIAAYVSAALLAIIACCLLYLYSTLDAINTETK